MSAERVSDGAIMQITSEPWQKVFAGVPGFFFVALDVGYALSALLPDRFHIAEVGNSPSEKMLELASALIISGLGFYIWWTTMKYRAYITAEGVGQTDGFRHVFVRWDQVHSYTMEQVTNRRGRPVEPVLRDADAHVIMKPMFPAIVYSRRGDEARAKFWRYVTDKVEQNARRRG